MSQYTIRPVSLDDSDELLAIYAPYVTDSLFTSECTVPTPEAFRRRIEGVITAYPYLVCLKDGKIVGYTYAHRAREREAYDWYAELSVYVRRDCHGGGVGTRLYSALIEILKAQNIQNLAAVISTPNPESEALHKKVGFVEAGLCPKTIFKKGVWRDTLMLYMFIGDHAAPPEPVIPITEMSPELIAHVCRRYSSPSK